MLTNSCLSLNANALPFSSSLVTTQSLEAALQIMAGWNFPLNVQNRVIGILKEWFANSTLNGIICGWKKNISPSTTHIGPLNVLSYNVQGWGTRALEVMDLFFNVDSSICVFTEVGEL